MKRIIFKTFALSITFIFISSCKKNSPTGGLAYEEPKLPQSSFAYKDAAKKLPKNTIDVTDDRATLGRVLFYEKALSVNNLISCGSCHIQNMGFADGRQFSIGFETLATPRNSPAIINAGAMQSFFWDARARFGLQNMVLMPVQNHLEMGIDNLDYAVAKINARPYYKPLLEKAYGIKEITKPILAGALANFLASMTVTNTKYDIGEANNFTNFSIQEKEGLELFTTLECTSCHNIELQTGGNWIGQSFANVGLSEVYEDKGMLDQEPFKNNDWFKGVFKVPSLRNIALTAPYMHDGRFATLEQVIEHYNSGVRKHPSLSFHLRNQALIAINDKQPFTKQRVIMGNGDDPWQLNLTQNEKDALVAFLKTLTDDDFISHPMYSNPF